jgi:hypothetical protein
MHEGNMTKDNERMSNSQEQLNAKHSLWAEFTWDPWSFPMSMKHISNGLQTMR